MTLFVLEPHLEANRPLGAVALSPFLQYVAFGLGLPTYWVLNMGGGVVATSLAGLVTIGAGLLVIDAVAQFADSRNAGAVPAEAR